MKQLIKHHWPALGLIFMVLILGYYMITSHKKVIKRAETIKHIVPSYAIQLKDVHYTHDNPDKNIKWELDAKNVIFSKDRKIITFYKFHLILHSKGRKNFDLVGDKGRYERQKNILYLNGNLKATYGNSYRMFTDSLIFNEKTGQGRSTDPVEIDGTFFNIKGKGLFLDIKKKKIKVLSDVKSIIQKSS